jgi:hypothetical protein
MISLKQAKSILEKHHKKQREIVEKNGIKKDLDRIKQKFKHSYEVLEMSQRLIAEEKEFLSLNTEIHEIMNIVSILHDIARFYEIGKYDFGRVTHGEYGAYNILQKFEGINNPLILLPIKYHDKYNLDGLSTDIKNCGLNKQKDLIFLISKFIRDADKMANFLFFKNIKYISYKKRELFFSKNVFEIFKKQELIDKKLCKTVFDEVLNFISWEFDLNFDVSRRILIKEEINKNLLNNFRELIEIIAKEVEDNKIEEKQANLKQNLLEIETILKLRKLI